MSDRLRMHGICKSYGPTAALRGVDLELRPGEVHALVGENGAGKSTLMKVLSGAEQPDAGTMDLETPNVLRVFVVHYNTHRPHRSLNLAPLEPSEQRIHPGRQPTAAIERRIRLGGLIHEYNRAA